MPILNNLLANGKISFPLLCSDIKHQLEPKYLSMETINVY